MDFNLFALVLLAIGLWYSLFPKSAIDLKAKWGKRMGIKMTYSQKTVGFMRIYGIIFVAIGLLFLFI